MLGILAYSLMTATRQQPGPEARKHHEEERRWLREAREARAKGYRHE